MLNKQIKLRQIKKRLIKIISGTSVCQNRSELVSEKSELIKSAQSERRKVATSRIRKADGCL